MMSIIFFIIGLFAGAFLGIFAMCLVQYNRLRNYTDFIESQEESD